MRWHASPDEVANPKNNRKPDCEFTCAGQVPVIAEISSLFPVGNHQQDQAKRAKLIQRLKPEFEREELGGLMIHLPSVQKRHAHPEWPRKAAARIREKVQTLPPGGHVELEDFSIARINAPSGPSFFCHSTFGAYWPVEAAGKALVQLLRKKHDQLDIDDHERVLIAVNAGCGAVAGDVAAACAFIDFHEYPNFDRIYFEESSAKSSLVYDRRAWVGMEHTNLDDRPDMRDLVIGWLEVRLANQWPGALDAVLRVCCDEHDSNWLSEGGRATLELEANLFIQNCSWNAPRQLWELFRGPVPYIGDGRRKTQAIHG